MSEKKNWDKIAKVEKAIKEKYGEENQRIQNRIGLKNRSSRPSRRRKLLKKKGCGADRKGRSIGGRFCFQETT